MNFWDSSAILCGLVGWAAFAQASAPERPVIAIESQEGSVIEAEVVSVLRQKDTHSSWLCFRKPGEDRLFLYPFASLSEASLTRLSTLYSGGDGFLFADGITSDQLDFLEEYLAAGPRERLFLELIELEKDERKLEREWERLRDQTWRVQQQLAAATPEMQKRIAPAFRRSLAARDSTRRQLVLLQAKIRRLESRIETLRNLGVPMDNDKLTREDVVFE